MGIFGGDKNNQAVSDDPVMDQPVQDQMQQQPSIDGVLPPQHNDDAAMSHSVDDLMSQTAPPVSSNDDAGGFIMTDAPVDTTQLQEEPEHVHDDQPEPINVSPVPSASDTPSPASDLAAIRQQALQQLSPLVSHLDQSPEEKFHTTMMMLQATDDQSLVKTAYEAAQAITNERTKAQALLDIINEINYFTQSKNS